MCTLIWLAVQVKLNKGASSANKIVQAKLCPYDYRPFQQVNVDSSAGRDAHADQVVRIKASTKREDSIRASVNPPGKDKDGNPTGLATQMSHQWINDRLEEENLVSEGLRLKKQLRLLRLSLAGDEVPDYPYKRWISLVTGRQLSKHQKSRGSIHEVQLVVDLPNNILKR